MLAYSKKKLIIKFFERDAADVKVLISFLILYAPMIPLMLYIGLDILELTNKYYIESLLFN